MGRNDKPQGLCAAMGKERPWSDIIGGRVRRGAAVSTWEAGATHLWEA